MIDSATSKRKSTQERGEIALTAVCLVCIIVLYLKPETGSSLMVLYSAMAAGLGYTGAQYQKGETSRPSGAPPGLSQ